VPQHRPDVPLPGQHVRSRSLGMPMSARLTHAQSFHASLNRASRVDVRAPTMHGGGGGAHASPSTAAGSGLFDGLQRDLAQRTDVKALEESFFEYFASQLAWGLEKWQRTHRDKGGCA
jgi:hypothetical protein